MKRFISYLLAVLTLAACQPAGNNEKSDIEKELEKIGLQNVAEEIPEAGWLVEPSEWWHFNAMPLTEASQKLTIIK